MTYKIACGVLLLGLIFLGTRMKVTLSEMDKIEESVKDVTEKNKVLEDQLAEANKTNGFLLEENGRITLEYNELKFTNSKPIIIYRNVKKNSINGIASKQYNELLTKRYSNGE
jgi:regulator of replication initiation timing